MFLFCYVQFFLCNITDVICDPQSPLPGGGATHLFGLASFAP